jgi:hypothetical protein
MEIRLGLSHLAPVLKRGEVNLEAAGCAAKVQNTHNNSQTWIIDSARRLRVRIWGLRTGFVSEYISDTILLVRDCYY